MVKHLISLKNISKQDIVDLIILARRIKKNSKNYENYLNNKVLLMLFAKPSLRTHISFDVAMYKLGGHAIFYDIANSPLGKKESIKDFAKVSSRYVDAIMARLFEHSDVQELSRWSDVPIINGLDNDEHPCQILGDFLTIYEKKKNFSKTKIAYIGDCNNNVTHSLIIGCNKVGMKIIISGPNKKEFLPNKSVIGNALYIYEENPMKAVKDCDIIYTDSWMSYHIPESQKARRVNILKGYQVNQKLFSINKKALFMHCLPAARGEEVTDEVMDSKQSLAYDQAENRLHIEKSILLRLLK